MWLPYHWNMGRGGEGERGRGREGERGRGGEGREGEGERWRGGEGEGGRGGEGRGREDKRSSKCPFYWFGSSTYLLLLKAHKIYLCTQSFLQQAYITCFSQRHINWHWSNFSNLNWTVTLMATEAMFHTKVRIWSKIVPLSCCWEIPRFWHNQHIQAASALYLQRSAAHKFLVYRMREKGLTNHSNVWSVCSKMTRTTLESIAARNIQTNIHLA